MLGRFSLGTIQGRLVPKLNGRYQAHPKGYWRDEFNAAAESGLELIEFILDYEDADTNPLLNDVPGIQRAIADSGVGVESICADYFMAAPLQRVSRSATVLEQLINVSGQLGIHDIVIPCVDQSSLRDENDTTAFINVIQSLAEKARTKDVNLCSACQGYPRSPMPQTGTSLSHMSTHVCSIITLCVVSKKELPSWSTDSLSLK